MKLGGCPARLVFSSKSLWLSLSSKMGLRVMFTFSKAVEISPVYCQSEGNHDWEWCYLITVPPAPALHPRALVLQMLAPLRSPG